MPEACVPISIPNISLNDFRPRLHGMPRIARRGLRFLRVCGLSHGVNVNGTVIANCDRSSGAERHMNIW
jgi:hypothetical protein